MLEDHIFIGFKTFPVESLIYFYQTYSLEMILILEKRLVLTTSGLLVRISVESQRMHRVKLISMQTG